MTSGVFTGNIKSPDIGKFGSPTGRSDSTSTEEEMESIWPNTSASCFAQNLSVRAISGDVTLSLRVNGSNIAAVSCATSGGTCTSSGTFQIPAKARVSMVITAGAAGQVQFGWECLQP